MIYNPLLGVDMPRRDNRLICYLHDDIINLCYEIINETNKKLPPSIIKQKLDRIIRYAERAKEKGTKMENRLSEYREALETLGFMRDK
jgi:hypothetical protein